MTYSLDDARAILDNLTIEPRELNGHLVENQHEVIALDDAHSYGVITRGGRSFVAAPNLTLDSRQFESLDAAAIYLAIMTEVSVLAREQALAIADAPVVMTKHYVDATIRVESTRPLSDNEVLDLVGEGEIPLSSKDGVVITLIAHGNILYQLDDDDECDEECDEE